MAVKPDMLRRTMRQWATGVAVVSSRSDGRIHGMTVSSFTSVSLDPPLVLVSLENQARTHAMVTDSGVFAVSVLEEDQREISDIFAGRVSDDENRFEGQEFTLSETGCPILEGSLAYLDCQVQSAERGGTHTVFLGLVLAAEPLRQGRPLLYYNQDYRRLDV